MRPTTSGFFVPPASRPEQPEPEQLALPTTRIREFTLRQWRGIQPFFLTAFRQKQKDGFVPITLNGAIVR
jgi:hypothetical protein